jgi:4'-phosphopantetheinyl transferase
MKLSNAHASKPDRWLPCNKTPVLEKDEVHIWLGAFDHSAPLAPAVINLLSEKEHARASRFRFRMDQSRYASSRAMLKTILGLYLSIHPEEVILACDSPKKPVLDGRFGGTLQFNLSHTDELTALALVSGKDIGIDIEKVKTSIDCNGIARRFFTRREAAAIQAALPESRTDTFFTCWVRKEALTKAIGSGLSMDLRELEVLGQPGEKVDLVCWADGALAATRWAIEDLEPSPGYVGALAVSGGHDWRLRKWRFDGALSGTHLNDRKYKPGKG